MFNDDDVFLRTEMQTTCGLVQKELVRFHQCVSMTM